MGNPVGLGMPLEGPGAGAAATAAGWLTCACGADLLSIFELTGRGGRDVPAGLSAAAGAAGDACVDGAGGFAIEDAGAAVGAGAFGAEDGAVA